MIKEIELQGAVTVPEDVTLDDFVAQFISFVEANGWSFGGGYREIIDGYYVHQDATKDKYVLDED